MTDSRTRGTRIAVVAGVLAAVVLGGGAALAGHEPGTVASYTGCLNASSGTLVNVAPGEAPAAICKEKETTIHLSGGDVTGVTAGAGLTGGGSEGSLTLTVDSSAIVTGVDPGFGLTGGGSGGDVGLSVDPTVIQKRVAATCPPGNAIRVIAESGGVTCSEPGGIVATLDAGRVTSEGSHDTSFCDGPTTSDGSSEHESVSAAVPLPAGSYLPVIAGDEGFDWLIRKAPATGVDPDDHFRGRAWAFIENEADQAVSSFIRDFSSAGQNNNNQRDFGVFTTAGGDFHLRIFAGAEACSYVSVGGPVALVRIG
jgi:hypothetical protein